MKLILGDCLQKLAELADNSVDSIVTDPPYGLSFMGKSWDYDVPSQSIWAECLRVLKPGGHLLAFFGTRTYHRGVCRIEDAGFEIRDQIMWVYGSGFPKSHNLKDEWHGWGTALKPANEPIVVARKPLGKGLTVAQNVLKWGTGALNIDGSRIELQPGETTHGSGKSQSNSPNTAYGDMGEKRVGVPNVKSTQGRWPANIMFDEEAAAMLDEQSGERAGSKKKVYKNNQSRDGRYGQMNALDVEGGYDDKGGASRFFYVAKASKKERGDGNLHPTVKPQKLMSHLINLVTPPNGIVLDPFMGSGSTGVAAKALGFDFIGIEREPQYFEIALGRIEYETTNSTSST